MVRVQKFTAGSVGGIQIHDRREKDHSNTNPDINWSMTGGNYDLCQAQNENFRQAANERIAQLNLPKAVRKDAIVMAQVLVTSDSEFFTKLHEYKPEFWDSSSTYQVYAVPDNKAEFFQDAYNFLAERYGKENVISATVHLDERTPHMHFNFVPVTADGRLSAKDVLTKATLTEQQDAFHEQVGKQYGLDRGEPKGSGKRRKHLETSEYKQAMEMENEARQRAREAATEEREARGRVETLKNEHTAIQTKIEGLQDELKKAEGRLDTAKATGKQLATAVLEANEELELVRKVINDEAAAGAAALGGMAKVRSLMEQERQKSQKEARFNLFERFLEQHPNIKAAFEQFVQLMTRGRGVDRGQDRGR